MISADTVAALRALIDPSPAVRAAAELEWLAVPQVEQDRVFAALTRVKRRAAAAWN